MRRGKSAGNLYVRIKNRIRQKIIKPLYRNKESRCGNGGLKAVHITYYKARNLGDTVLSQCVRKTFGKLCGVTYFDIIAVDEPVTDDCIERINRADMLIIGGGGLFLADTNENSVSGWQWAVSADKLKDIRVPVVIYSVGYNYFRGQSRSSLFEENFRLIAQKSEFMGLRNRGSCRVVGEILNGEDKNVIFQPCTTTLIRKLYPELPGKKVTGKVAFNIAFDREELRFGDAKEIILAQIARAAGEIEKRGYKIFYAAHCREDLRFTEYLDREGVRYKKENMSEWFPQRAVRFYNEMDCVLAMRGHAQMIPFGVNTEIISLGTHEKLRWFLEDINAADWYIELTEDPEHLSEKIVETFIRIHETDAEKTRKRLLSAQNELWDITVRNAERIKLITREKS